MCYLPHQENNPTLLFDLVQKRRNDFLLTNTRCVKVLSDSQCQLVFGDPSLILASCHRRRISSEPRCQEYILVMSVGKGGWDRKAMCVAVGGEDGGWKGGPGYLGQSGYLYDFEDVQKGGVEDLLLLDCPAARGQYPLRSKQQSYLWGGLHGQERCLRSGDLYAVQLE
jgi:hypothetical protein